MSKGTDRFAFTTKNAEGRTTGYPILGMEKFYWKPVEKKDVKPLHPITFSLFQLTYPTTLFPVFLTSSLQIWRKLQQEKVAGLCIIQ